ncbi:TonB-dependent receptor [Bacteroides sp.]|uniref:TonB-dependent receptor domain-containing protein n=1 Tax=Bacteroides sp. TaxID=29523 RepID=UPI0023D342BB|nr:TonB-dependent receptor [Bacteroides sp.]MDE5710425.1 TonB-dependent receptor family protein [Bacteroides sp.]MDE5760161.1 TonB-dependent receptor family protein [Bacteroides sp.]MDE6217159.1 TonB-dependent receptor family protein [Bacteroides sp.]
MRTKWMVLLWMLMVSGLAMAQNTATSSFQIKGVLLDSLTNEGEPYATIKVVKKEAPAKALKMLVTNMKGQFQEKVPGTGNFVLTITSVGRTPIVKEFSVKAGEKLVDFGTLYITDASNELGQVEVVAQKPLVKADIDKIEYNVQDDPDSQSNSLLEMLRKVPLVTVDGEDNIQVNGSSSFKVYVNGKPNNMMSNNPTEVLKSMPANSIKHIEVITNPGPKYDAEGVGGILNIVTVGGGLEGYTVTFSGNASNRGAGGGAFGTIKSGKLTVSARYNYNYNNQPRSYSSGSQLVTSEAVTENSSNLNYSGNSKGNGSFQSGSMEASYEIDTLRLVTMSFGLWGGGNKNRGTMDYLASSPMSVGADPLYDYSTYSHSKSSWYSIDGGIDYQRLFKVKDRMLTFSYKINTRPQTSNSYTEYDIEEGYSPNWEDYLNRLRNLHNDGNQNTTEHTFQADYTTPIGKLHTLEAGAKYILRNNSSENDRFDEDDAGKYEYNKDQSSHYKHLNDILAAYLGYGLKVKKFSGRLGLRYEHTIQDVKYLVGRGEDFTKNFDDVVPSASIGYKLTDMSNLRLGYNMRIYRPGIWSLNPYLDDSNPSYISQGNPELDSEKSHSLNLSYSNFTRKFNINLSARYSFTNNSIESVTVLMPDTEIEGLKNPTGKDVLYSTYANIGKSRRASMSAYVNWNATSRTRIYMNMSGDYSYLKGGEGMCNDGWSLFAFGGVQQTLPHDWRVSLNVFGQTPWIMLQGKGSSFFDYSLNVNKSFLKKRLTLSAFASNFFKNYMEQSSTTEGNGFLRENCYKYSRQRFGISVSYRIGELKASVKKAARTISNDDVKSGGSGNGGGGE